MNKDSGSITAIVGTFEALKCYVKPDSVLLQKSVSNDTAAPETGKSTSDKVSGQQILPQTRGMNLSYTINLNLPASKDIEVFNAIFKSLKENLLN